MKYIKWVFILPFAVFVSFALYLEFGGRFFINDSDKQMITNEIRSSRKLPENFADFYNTVYPDALQNNSWNYLFTGLVHGLAKRTECPCNQMAYRLFPILQIRNKKGFDQFSTARYIEHHFNQMECLAFNFEKSDFLDGRRGLAAISRSLFNKETKNLQLIEMAEILALSENPGRYNRLRNPEKAQERAEQIYNTYLDNLKMKN